VDGARNKKIFDLWLACYTQEEIAQAVSCDKASVSRFLDDLLQDGKLADPQQPATDTMLIIFCVNRQNCQITQSPPLPI
jgi:hypothetical protein